MTKTQRTLAERERDALLVDPAMGELLHMPRPVRSPRWERVREEHLRGNHRCAACEGTDDLEVHHLKPFHLFPELELVPGNLITLCTRGVGGMNCHLVFGHGGNWTYYSEYCRGFANWFKQELNNVIKPPGKRK